ncbi:MAG: hypothetical protein R3B67_02375 [Phycisphaerales bacterium]
MDETRDGKHAGEGVDGGSHPSIRLAPIDHEEYDALAELFLGDGGMAPAPFQDGRPTHATHTPVLHLAATEDDGVAEEELETASGGVMASLRATDAHASKLMAELMGQDDPQSEEGVEFVRLPNAQVEVIVLGHLPVRATLWARQYACSSAKASGEVVALVRAASGSTAIDLITGREPVNASGSADLQGALETIHETAERVVLRVDERHEPELLDRPEVGMITVLTGADEAAVVASYRLIKTIDASLRDRFEVDEDGPMLRIAVMGAGLEQAEDARYKLQNAVDSFIERPVEIVIGSARIDATGTTNIFRDTVAHHGGELIDGLVALAHRVEMESPAAVVETRPIDAGEVRGRRADSAPRPHRDEPRESLRDVSSSPDVRDGLCALIEGVRPIETRCPKAPGVEMGTDEQGRLHLLACDADCEEALERLYVAQSWARDHLGLLLRAEPGLRIPCSDPMAESDAVMHLMSYEPAALQRLYDTRVRMYALARVRVGGVIAQVATPLN